MQEIEDPVLVAVNAGASVRAPTSAVIARKRKLPANEGKYKQRGSSKTTVRTSIQKFGFINGVDNVNWPPYRDSKS